MMQYRWFIQMALSKTINYLNLGKFNNFSSNNFFFLQFIENLMLFYHVIQQEKVEMNILQIIKMTHLTIT